MPTEIQANQTNIILSHSDRINKSCSNITEFADNYKLNLKYKDTVALQQKIIRYIVAHPEDLDLIKNVDWFERFERDIFVKLRNRINEKVEFSFGSFLAELSPNEQEYYKNFIESKNTVPPENKYNAQLICDELQREYFKVRKTELVEKLFVNSGSDKDLRKLIRELEDYSSLTEEEELEEIDPRNPPEEVRFMFKQIGQLRNEGLIPFGNLSRIKAKIKQGKSKAVDLLAGIALARNEVMSLKGEYDVKVLLFDTEQNKPHVYSRRTRIARLAGLSEKEPSKDLKVFAMRKRITESKEKAREAIIKEIRKEYSEGKPLLVFIDGINDLGDAELDDKAAKKIVSSLMDLTNDAMIAIVGVIHENRNSTTTKGWLGLVWDEKAASLLQVKKNDGYFTLKQEDSRDGEIRDIDFKLEDNLTLVPVGIDEILEKDRKEKENIKNKKIWIEIFGSDKSLSQTELAKKLEEYRKKKGNPVKKSQCTHIISQAKDEGILHKGEGRTGKYSIVPDEAPKEETLDM